MTFIIVSDLTSEDSSSTLTSSEPVMQYKKVYMYVLNVFTIRSVH